MSASPELRRSPPELFMRPVPTPVRQAERKAPKDGAGGGNDDYCQTPSSEDSKIPAARCCPPAPKKARPETVSCRRRLLEAEFLKVGAEEIDRFFMQRAQPREGGVITAAAASSGCSKRKRSCSDADE